MNTRTVVILSTISRLVASSPLRSFGSMGRRNRGAPVGSVVKAQIVMESVASKLSSWTMTTGRGFPAYLAAGDSPDVAAPHSFSQSDTASMNA